MGIAILGDMLVRYRADISDLSNKVKQAKSEMSTVDETAKKTGTGIFSGFTQGVKGAISFGAQIGQTVSGVQALANSAIGLGQALLEPNASMEQTTVGFETLLGKGQKTQAFLKDLQNFAAATPFEFPELSTDAEHMLAFGFSAKEVIPDLTAIGDAMSAMGKSNAEIDSIVTVFGQMKAAGKVNAQDMMQLTSQGIPAWKMLAQAMHLTVPEVQALSQKGLLPADKSIKMLTAGMEKMFGGGMKSQATTFNGLLSTFHDNASAAMRAFTGPLFDKAKSGLTQLGNLVSGPQFQAFATGAGAALGTAFDKIGSVIVPIVVNFAKFVNWLQEGSAPATAVGIALAAIAGGFAAIQIGAFIAAVPAIVGGFIAWSVAAWSAAIATIAATWPIFLIGVAVVAVVALIILAVKNWGAISHWLVGAWKAAIGWLGGALNSIGQFFVGVWNWIKSATTAAWNFLVGIVKAGAHFLYLAIFGPFIAIGALFQWLYNHNTYFKMLIDAIVNITKAGIAWLVGAWKAAIGWLGGAWHTLSGLASSAWNAVRNAVMSVVTPVINWLRSTWQGEVQLIGALWGLLSGLASKAWNAVVGVFRSVWGPISGALSSLWGSISGWFNGLVGKMLGFGKALIQGLIDGINSMLGAIGNAASNVASTITGILGFHKSIFTPPKEGPAKNADKWAPDFMRGFAEGIEAGIPRVRTATSQMVYPIKPSGSNVVVVGGGSSSAGSSGQGQTFILEVDGHRLAQIVNTSTDRIVRLKLGANGRAA